MLSLMIGVTLLKERTFLLSLTSTTRKIYHMINMFTRLEPALILMSYPPQIISGFESYYANEEVATNETLSE